MNNHVLQYFKDAFIVYSNTDLIEGRGVEYPRDICLSEITAKRLSKSSYIQRTDCPIYTRKIFRYENMYYGPILLIHPTIADQQEQILLNATRKLESST